MCVAEAVNPGTGCAGGENLWAVRVLLAGALARALRYGLRPDEVREMFEEIVRDEEESDE